MGNNPKTFKLSQAQASITHNSLEIFEIKLLNQFSDILKPIILHYNTANSICGYLAPVISNYLAKAFEKREEFNKIIEELKKPEIVIPSVENSIQFIQNCRRNYINSHIEEFNEEQKKSYMKDWVANFEISDYILSLNDKNLKNLFFFRHVGLDFPEVAAQCTYEEKKRLEEEIPFKGKKYFIEGFFEERRFYSIEEWKMTFSKEVLKDRNEVFFVGDMNGHFVSFVFSTKVCAKPVLILFDTTEASYIDRELVKKIAELFT